MVAVHPGEPVHKRTPHERPKVRGCPTPVVVWALACALAGPLVPQVQAQGGAGPGTGRVSGVVTDDQGVAVVGAEVRSGRTGPVRTDAAGRFDLRGVVAGTVRVEIRRLGFEPASAAVKVPRGGVAHLEVRLVSAPAALDSVRVTAAPEAFAGRLAGFDARRRGGRGHFIDRERIEQSASGSVIDLLRTAPGVRIGRTGTIGSVPAVRFRGANCPPLVFIDGFPATAGEFDLSSLELQSIEGIEMYASLASVPAELLGPRGLDRCGVIGIWTRPLRARSEPGDAGTGPDTARARW